MFKDLKKINYKLFFVLLLASLIPALYSTFRVYFIGKLPDAYAFSIAAQIVWLGVFYEVINEGLLKPLFVILGEKITNREEFAKRISLSFVIYVAIYFFITVIVLYFSPELLNLMHLDSNLVRRTSSYIRLESIGIFLSSAYLFCYTVFLLKDKKRVLFSLLTLKAFFTIVFDTLLLSESNISLNLGINGIAYTNIIVNSILCVYSLFLLKKEGLVFLGLQFKYFLWMKKWFQLCCISGLESLTRNLAFMFVILRLINETQQAGIFWVTNQFFWNWLLLPIMALGNLIQKDAACNKTQDLPDIRINSYLILTVFVVCLWFITMPFWPNFIMNIMGVVEYQKVYDLVILIVGFYVIFALNNVIDSYFYGIGRMDLILYQTLLVNFVFYGIVFALYSFGLLVPSLNKITIMFGLGITFDAITTFGLYHLMKTRSFFAKNKIVSV